MNSDMLEKVLAYIDNHINEKIDLCALAELVGYSPFYFSKIFSETMGIPTRLYSRIAQHDLTISNSAQSSGTEIRRH